MGSCGYFFSCFSVTLLSHDGYDAVCLMTDLLWKCQRWRYLSEVSSNKNQKWSHLHSSHQEGKHTQAAGGDFYLTAVTLHAEAVSDVWKLHLFHCLFRDAIIYIFMKLLCDEHREFWPDSAALHSISVSFSSVFWFYFWFLIHSQRSLSIVSNQTVGRHSYHVKHLTVEKPITITDQKYKS